MLKKQKDFERFLDMRKIAAEHSRNSKKIRQIFRNDFVSLDFLTKFYENFKKVFWILSKKINNKKSMAKPGSNFK